MNDDTDISYQELSCQYIPTDESDLQDILQGMNFSDEEGEFTDNYDDIENNFISNTKENARSKTGWQSILCMLVLTIVAILLLSIVYKYLFQNKPDQSGANPFQVVTADSVFNANQLTSTPIINQPQFIKITNVNVLSRQTDNPLDPTSTLDKLTDNNYNTYWNSLGNVVDYRLQFTFTVIARLSSIVFVSTGDTIHDATGFELYPSADFQGTPLFSFTLATGTHAPQVVDISSLSLTTSRIFMRVLPAALPDVNQPRNNLLISEIQFIGTIVSAVLNNAKIASNVRNTSSRTSSAQNRRKPQQGRIKPQAKPLSAQKLFAQTFFTPVITRRQRIENLRKVRAKK